MSYTGSGGLLPQSGGGSQPGDPYSGGTGRVAGAGPTPPSGQPAGDPFNGPGSIDFNLTDPSAAVQQAQQTSTDMFTGLKAFLFGTDQPDSQGKHGGVIGDIAGVGDVARFGSEVVANVGGGALGHAADAVGGALERIPTGLVSGVVSNAAGGQSLQQQFDALPDSPEKQAALKQMESDKGLFGTGLLSGREAYMSKAIQAQQETDAAKSPDLWTGMFRPSATLADTVANLFGLLGVSQRATERAIAGAGRAGNGGMNQLQMVMAVGDGNAVWTADDPGLTPVEQMAYDSVKSGKWSDSQALDFLASHGAGLNHSKALEIAGSMAADPLNVATLGAGALAKFGETGFALTKTLESAQAGLKAAQAAGDVEKVAQYTKAIEVAQQGIKTGAAGEGIADRNLLGQLAKRQWTGDVARRYGAMYGSLEGTDIGKVFKIARTVIDPLHAVSITPKGSAAIEEGSRDVTQAVVAAHGELSHIDAINKLRALPGGDQIADLYNNGLAIYSGNVFRRVSGRQFRAVQMMMTDKGERLIDTLPFESLKAATTSLKRNALTQLTEEAQKFVKGEKAAWTAEDDANLAKRMETLWNGEPGGYKDFVGTLSPEQKSLMHAATYGSAVKQLHGAIEQAVREGTLTADEVAGLKRHVLLNRTTLTDLGHGGIMSALEGAANDEARVAIIEQAKQTYPELRSFVVDPTSRSETVRNFTEMMDRIQPRLPAQVRYAERGSLPPALQEFNKLISPTADPADSIFTLGFRPKDEFLWGLERDANGVLREATDPWLDQASDNVAMYSPVREVPTNIAGVPIVGAIATKAAKALDYSEAIGRTAFHGVTGTMVTTAAHNKFVSNLHAAMRAADGTEVLTKDQVENIWKAVIEKANTTDNVSSARGLSEGAIWNAAKSAIPSYAQRAGLGPRELMVHVLDAYDGDIRTIGLSQKLTGRVKAMLGRTFVGNTAGVISEHAWPLLKFRLNPFFQLQEKIEPWVLTAQRGGQVAFGTRLSELDRKAMDVYTNFAEKNLINIADNDISELGAKFALGKGITNAARAEKPNGIGRFFKSLEGATDVQGTKQLNQMRTWRKGLGDAMRREWEQTNPGEFDKMLNEYRGLMGEAISPDDFAVLHAHQNLAANGVFSKVVDGVPHLDFGNAIMEGQWSAPQHLGEMQAINLDYMAQRLALSDNAGRDLRTSMDIRRALASGNIQMSDIRRALVEQAAHPDYISRVDSAFRFSYNDFWHEAQSTFGMTDAERARFEGLFARIAQNRGMTPTEYLSQVYHPHIARGQEASVGSLGSLVDFARAGGHVDQLPDLAQLRGVAGQSTIRDLYQQFGQVMAHHLDPSAKRAFLNELMGSGNAPESITDILDTWDQLGATERLMDRVMNFVQGTPGTGEHTLVADEATGVERIRNAAAEYRQRQGRPRSMQRVTYADSPEMQSAAADAMQNMADYNHVPTPAELADRVDLPTVELRAKSSAVKLRHQREGALGLPSKVRDGYAAQTIETRRLYDHIVSPVSEGGLGIKVQTRATEPYADGRALRADLARNVIKVPRDGYWHPVMDTTDAFMQRVVKDVFGAGQEDVALGSHDHSMSAAAMYSDAARPTYLTDEFGHPAWEASDHSRIRQGVDYPQTVQEYEDTYGVSAPRPNAMTGQRGLSEPIETRAIGNGLRAAPEELQREIVSTTGEFRSQFPNVPLGSIDIGDLSGHGASAATLAFPVNNEAPTIVYHRPAGWQTDAAERAFARQHRLARNEAARNPVTGVPELASGTARGDMWHEMMHALDAHLHQQGEAAFGTMQRSVYADDAFTNFMDWYRDSGTAAKVSKYAAEENGHPVLTDSEGFAELGDLAFNPDHAGAVLDPQVQQAVDGFRAHLERMGEWHPQGTSAAVNPYAGKTVAEARAAGMKPGDLIIPRKVGLMPQETLDSLTGHFLGNGRYAESNPDVARIAGYMRNYLGDATEWTLQHEAASEYAHLFDHMSGMPVADRVPFNATEAAFWNGQAQMMAAKWQDAFRLQYFAQNRSVLQRSINHPMFGLYPASYMWGKIGPEMVKFMALEPFGMKTGAMGYSLMDIQKAVGVQRAYDPEFDKAIDKLGHSAALSWLGYMLPATPWSVPAGYPAWMRDMANQGLKMNAKQESGANVPTTDFISPLNATLKKAFPMSTQLPFFGRAMKEVGAGLPWNAKQPTAPSYYGQSPLDNLPPAEPPKPAPATPTTGALSEPTPATALAPTLGDSMRSLQDSLFG